MGQYWNEVIPVGAEAVQPDHGERWITVPGHALFTGKDGGSS